MVELSTVTSECLSELVLDEWSAGELSPEQQQRCAAHLETCSTCRARKLALEQANTLFYQSAPTFKALKRMARPTATVDVDEITPQRRESDQTQALPSREASSDEALGRWTPRSKAAEQAIAHRETSSLEAPERLMPRSEEVEQARASDEGLERWTPRSSQPKRRRVSLGWVSAPLLAACALLTFVALREPGSPTLQDATRAKGSPRLGYYVKRGDEVRRGEAATVVHPGDSVRFVYSADDAYYLAIFSADARGVGVYFPSGPTAERVPAGQDVALDFSVELDDALGRERVTALFCPEAFEIEPVQRAASSGSPMPASLASCANASFELNKQAP